MKKLLGMELRRKVEVDEKNEERMRNGYGKKRLSKSVNGGGEKRKIELDIFGDKGEKIKMKRNKLGMERMKKKIVECERE